jgi:hypothetical protein
MHQSCNAVIHSQRMLYMHLSCKTLAALIQGQSVLNMQMLPSSCTSPSTLHAPVLQAGDTLSRNTYRNGSLLRDIEAADARGMYTSFCG